MNFPGPIRIVSPAVAAVAAPLIVDCELLAPAGQPGSFTHHVVARASEGPAANAAATDNPRKSRFRSCSLQIPEFGIVSDPEPVCTVLPLYCGLADRSLGSGEGGIRTREGA
jgi:hypothetical protein